MNEAAGMDAGRAAPAPGAAGDGVLRLAIMAVGGQGGGVLTRWIEATARACGHEVQATSVAGVAQRTGATIYYIEMTARRARPVVFSLAPAAGDVDVLVAAELMEAGRAIMRGFVTPDRTVLIASTHRALAVSEKIVPGDGIASSEEVLAAAAIAARRTVMFDMERIAQEAGSVISASLLGAVAGSGALPFAREAFEAAVRASGRGAEASLRAFSAAFSAAQGEGPEGARESAPAPPPAPRGPDKLLRAWRELEAEAAALPEEVREYALPGLRKTVDFQDLAYGREYLDRVRKILARDDPARGHALTAAAAKYIANAMAYDDVIRVADLKTRPGRFARIRAEIGAAEADAVRVTEHFSPGAPEIIGLLPQNLARRILARPRAVALIERLFARGRRMRSDRLLPFLQLHLLAGLRRRRRRSLRHAQETAHMEAWLAAAMAHVPERYDLAVEILRCRRLIKGYSDTHARGLSKFDRVMEGIALVRRRPDAADWARRLRAAALEDEKGEALDGVLKTIRSFAEG